MKLILTAFLLGITLNFSFSQEICNNGIDDDADGFIDLNDDECDCEGIPGVIESLIPNHSFEDMDCCPATASQMECATDWIQASDATSDYLHSCDYSWGIGASDGLGHAGFVEIPPGYSEYIGSELYSPLLAGVEYTLRLDLNRTNAVFPPFLELVIYGSPTIEDLPWVSFLCPLGIGDWVVVATIDVDMTDVPPSSWKEFNIVFTPTVDINVIAIGGACTPIVLGQKNYGIDNIIVMNSENFSDITESGSWCSEDLILEANIDTIGGEWQWYKEGIALLGETDAALDASLHGLGNYSVIYFLGDNCLRYNHLLNSNAVIDANFEFSTICPGEPVLFDNTSEYFGLTPLWEWEIGGEIVSTEENPTHTFIEAGTHTVTLIANNEYGCTDTVQIDVTVKPAPIADFEFVIGSSSSLDGLTGSCIDSEVQFNDLSTIAEPGVITSWSWDFGGDGTSTDENPTHLFSSAGTYTITLIVETENGCTSTFELDIIMTDGLELELIVNEPTCFGFSDGSVTANVTGGGGDLTFEITTSDGEILNDDNSNTANSLESGWYYVLVSNETECSAVDSIFLDQPNELVIDFSTTDPRCYGFETGRINIDSVFNATGSYDGISYLWNGIGGLGEDSLANVGAGNYVLTINDENGCSAVFDFEINEPDSLYFSEFGFEHAYCRLYGYQNGNGVVFGAAGGGTPDYSYIWTNLNNGETDIYSTWGGLNPSSYELTATDDNGCTLTQTLYLDSLNPIAAFTVNSAQLNTDCQGTAVIEVEFVNNSDNYANTNNPTADTTFFWNLNTPNANWQISHDFHTPFDTIYSSQGDTYYADVCLVAINKNGCTDSTCKTITIYEPIAFSAINIFSPNGDGINDAFTFDFKAASILTFNCIIINRWGAVVAELNAITDGWDGRDKSGSTCKDGVYFYKYEATTANNTKLNGQGTVQLIDSP
ncbi:MAG: gliding motility-associated-like protein [Crocinitomix sp.]|jgi:gliding motility-associated-like protein